MRKVFIDLGAGSGDDIKGYYNLYPGNKLHEIYAFEPNPRRTIGIAERYPAAHVYTAAAGVEDTTSKLYLGNSLNTNSLNINKVSVNKNNYIDVRVIDICKWMKNNFSYDDYITMVIDIEGGEYEVLQAMYDQQLWEWVDQLYVEFHGEKLANFDIEIENTLVDKLIDFYGDRVYIYRKHQHQQFLKLNAEGS